MFFEHPFGSWAQGNQGHSAAPTRGAAPPPSVFGALPYPSSNTDLVTFYFTDFRPNIFNCTVVGSNNQSLYKVITDNNMAGYTIIKGVDGKNVSLIEWQSHPYVEIRGVLAKQNVKNWLRLSPDRSHRTMDVRGMHYVWVPRDKSIDLYATIDGPPRFLGRLTRSGSNVITVDMTADAIQLGLRDTIITATTLLLCGRNID